MPLLQALIQILFPKHVIWGAQILRMPPNSLSNQPCSSTRLIQIIMLENWTTQTPWGGGGLPLYLSSLCHPSVCLSIYLSPLHLAPSIPCSSGTITDIFPPDPSVHQPSYLPICFYVTHNPYKQAPASFSFLRFSMS